VLPNSRNRKTRERVWSAILERYRGRPESGPERIEFDFPRDFGRRAARDEVMAALNEIDLDWPRVFALYPREDSL
jgi:hypothetical protein